MGRITQPLLRRVRHSLGLERLNASIEGLDGKLSAIQMQIAGLLDSEFGMARSKMASTDAPMLDYASLTGDPPAPTTAPTGIKRGSRICRQADLSTDAFRYWISQMRLQPGMDRKRWEFFFVADALYQRGQLKPGHEGIGFGVGREPLPALFASLGCNILATDMAAERAASAGWTQTGEHADSLRVLNLAGICGQEKFAERVNFRVVDMNDVPADLNGQFDFCWSSCALEHLGSLEHGMKFIERSMAVLRPNGISIHTTEYNMSSNTSTLETSALSLYRRRDLDALAERLQAAGQHVEPIDWDPGHGYADGYVDVAPYFRTPLHLRLKIESYNCTSVGLIARRSPTELNNP